MATLRNKRKLAAVSRETPESTRSGRTQNILDPELTQDYISQVSEEIEGRVTKKLSKEFSRTESGILGALSKLDEFLLNPQFRACSVAFPGTSRSSNLENQGTNEDRPSDDPGPEVEFSSPHYGAETDLHNRPFYCNTKTDVIGKFKVVITDTIYKDEFCAVRSKAYVLTKPHTHLNGGEREKNKPEGKNKSVTKTMETDEIVKCLKWDPNKNNG